MKYTLNDTKDNLGKEKQKKALSSATKKLFKLMSDEKKPIIFALIFIILSAVATLVSPMLISHIIDKYIQTKQFKGVIIFSSILLLVYIVGLVSNYFQTTIMGGVGRRILFNLRNNIFNKLQELPIAFFNQNKAGDLISRINNDTDKLNQFFAQAFTQFISGFFVILGTGIFIIYVNPKLGSIALLPALFVLLITRFLSGWVKDRNLKSLQSLGKMSAEIQESINNFKVIIVFNRLDYFRKKFSEVNDENYKASINSGIASNVFSPIYNLSYSIAQLLVLCFGISFISSGNFTIGLLVGFFLYLNNFYMPLRQIASVWSSFQLSLAALDRITEILSIKSDMKIIEDKNKKINSKYILEFDNVSFAYSTGENILENISLSLERGKTYAFVGPTGGGKTTTASLMARLYDPTGGNIILDGKNIKSYTPEERIKKIGFILQEPFLFNGTIKDNIIYGNNKYKDYSDENMIELLRKNNLDKLTKIFKDGINTKVTYNTDDISLGQKQIIAFMRAILKEPEILILDEATANIDTVTENILEEILNKLPKETTKVVIAHRLNTIENADEIFFVNYGIKEAGTMENAVNMLMNDAKKT